jgi:NHL repeat
VPADQFASRIAVRGAIVALAAIAFATLGASPASASIQYDRQFSGTLLDGNLMLLPSRVAVDASGNAFVTDTGNNRIQEFDSSGSFVRKWGAVGTNNGQLAAPQGIAANASGNVYVADTGNNRIQEFSSSGAFITKWGTVGTGNGQFAAPEGVAIDSSGNVYVADTGNNRIQKFDSSGNFIAAWGSVGVGNGQLSLPSAVGIDSGGNAYVADSGNSRIEEFDSSGSYVRKWGTVGTGDGQFGATTTPSLDLAIGSSDNVVVVDPTNNRVEKFRPIGTFITKWGSTGTGNGQFLVPAGIAVSSSDSVHVVDRGVVNGRVEVFHETDTSAPDTSLDSGPSGVTNGDVSFTFSSAESPLLSPGFECRLDTAEWQACGSPQPYTNLTEGTHTFRVRAVDAAGNPDPSPSSRTWTVDRTPPETTLGSGPPSLTNDPSPSFGFSSSELGSSFECRLDSSQPADWQACTPPKAYSLLSDGSHTFEVRATDAVGNTDASPASAGFVVDTQAPAPPQLTRTDPASPASSAAPKFKGSAEAGSTVKLYKTAGCTGPAAAQGTAAQLASPGIAASVPKNLTTSVRATARDAAGNTSQCSSPISYVEDSKAPAKPQIAATDPASPANFNAPKLEGTAESGSKVRLYKTADCTGSAAAQGSAAQFASPGIAVHVGDNSTSSFRATARDAAGNTSKCSAPIDYVEDSRAPGPPAITVVNPVSPANDNQPRLRGYAAAPSTVTIYTTPDCAGPPVASGSSSQFHSGGLAVSVADDTTTGFRAVATDPAGNRSQCSARFSYVEDSTPPKTTITFGPPSTTTNRRPAFRFQSSETGSTFKCRFDSKPFGRCSGPGASHRPYVALAIGSHSFEVVATDKAGNADATPSRRTFMVVP